MAGAAGADYTALFFNSTDTLSLHNVVSSANAGRKFTSALYRDPSAWYHMVAVFDTTNATANDRMILYVNGVRITSYSVDENPSASQVGQINNNVIHTISKNSTAAVQYIDGYLTEINFIDGQALTPSSFGATDATTGVWQPKQYTGTYGTNGFYLKFNSFATAAALGTDSSGNSNTWTVNNISVTAGTTYDSMTDVPTLTSATVANYPTWNPLTAGGLVTFSEANLKALSTSASAPSNIESTMKTSTTGKWYAEVTVAVGANNPAVGIGNNPSTSNSNTDQYAAYRAGGTYITSGMGASSSGTPATYTTNDVIGIAYDVAAGTLVFYKNGTLQTGGFTGITAGSYSFIVRKDSASGDGGFLNCGQRPFSYTPPSGFVALNTYNLSTPTIANGAAYMAATTYTGNGSTQTIANTVNGVSFQPDFVWLKGRSSALANSLYDSVRGVTLDLVSNTAAAETTQATGLTAFGSTGFTLGALSKLNFNGTTFVGWQWYTNGGSSSSNTSGTITSTVSAGATQGFSIVTYTGTGTAGTVGHGLGAAPSAVLVKSRSGATGWFMYDSTSATPITTVFRLDSTAAQSVSAGFWSSLATSSVFGVGTSANFNTNGAIYIAYCFSSVAGFSAVGRYTGNGSTDGPFVYLGFRPKFTLIRRTDATANWKIHDTSRDLYNVTSATLYPNATTAETSAATEYWDILSNGFKLRTTDAESNASGGTYFYMAFAENPFKYSLAR